MRKEKTVIAVVYPEMSFPLVFAPSHRVAEAVVTKKDIEDFCKGCGNLDEDGGCTVYPRQEDGKEDGRLLRVYGGCCNSAVCDGEIGICIDGTKIILRTR